MSSRLSVISYAIGLPVATDVQEVILNASEKRLAFGTDRLWCERRET